jgi:hypothetical protein
MPFNEALDFTRASSATARTATGTIQGVAIDEQRLVGNREGLLIEESRTNLLLNSAALSTQSVTVAAVQHTLHFTGTGTVTLSGTFTGSLVGTGTGESNRVSLTFTPTAGTLTATVTGSVVDSQLEQGSSPSSYIPTAGTQVTRAADDCVRVLGDEFNLSGFTYYVEFTYLESQPYTAVIGSNVGTLGPIAIQFFEFSIDLRGALGLGLYNSAVNAVANTTYKIAASINTETGALNLVLDGVLIMTSSADFTGVDLTPLLNFRLNRSNRDGNAIYKDVHLFPTALSEAELITLTGGN